MLPDYPLSDSIDMIKTADELGFYACYSVDETWHKDLWVLFAAAADKTERIRFGPNVTHVFLREPTLICQQLATLDELTGGRAEAVVSTGNFGLLAAVPASTGPPEAAVAPQGGHARDAHLPGRRRDHFEGDFFHYNGLYTFARPVQERIPLRMGGMKGPRSFDRRPARSPTACTTRCPTRARPTTTSPSTCAWAPTRPAATSTTSTSGPGS